MPAIYILGANVPMLWGDYGGILAHGMGKRNNKGQFELERVGPFIPPISLPFGAIIVTDAFKTELESSGLSGLSYRQVVKTRVVLLEWEKWDWKANDPGEYPDESEPENYILENPHSPTASDKMGELWELILEERADTERVRTGPRIIDQEIYLKLDKWDGRDWFTAKGVGYHYVSQKAKSWLENKVPEWGKVH
jgi:hypothetical protein